MAALAPSQVFLMAISMVLPGATSASAARGGVTPIQKVLQLLEGMLEKGKEAKHQEEVAFAKFHEWCEGVNAEKTASIKQGAEQITQLSADIAKAESDAETLGAEVKELHSSIGLATKDASSAKAVREKEHADYMAAHLDHSESIDAIERAVGVLKAKMADVPQSLLQVQRLPLLPAHAKAAIKSFLGLQGGELAPPEANAYEFQSGGVVAMLEKLASEFKEERLAMEKAEMNAKHNFQQLMQQLEDDIKADTEVASTKTTAKAGRLEDAAEGKRDKSVAAKAKAEDETVLADTQAECRLKSEEFEKNQVTRAGEVKAIQKAMEIISSASVAGAAETHLPAAVLLQGQRAKKARSLAQAHAAPHTDSEVQRRAAAYLQKRASELGSRYLSFMAARAKEDVFAKVKKMIHDLIIKLREEANSEADHHAYCTSELATNKQTRERTGAEADKLANAVDGLTATSTQLATEIQQLNDAMAELKGQQGEATTLRMEEKAANAKAVADAKEAQAAVQQAIEVLRAFYAKAKDASMIQAARAPYKGMQGDSTGVLGMLDVVLSDFARLETETSAAEDAAASAHEKYMRESDEDFAVKGTELKHMESKKLRTEDQLSDKKRDLGHTQDQLSAAEDYYAKLKAECLDTGLSNAERKKGREEEIQSLKAALQILNGEDLAGTQL